MAEITLKRTAEYLRVVIDVLWTKPDGLPAGEILSRVKTTLSPMVDELQYIPGTHIPRYEQITRLAVNPLVAAGWFIKSRERWYLSDDGKSACKNYRNPEEFYKAALLVADKKKQLYDELAVVLEEAEEKAWTQIWRYLYTMNPVEFKYAVADLLRALGFQLDWVAPPGKNRGQVDMVAYGAGLGSGPRLKVHVRHTGQAATVEGLRAFLDVLTPNDFGVFVSSGGFTEQAQEQAHDQEKQRVRLVDPGTFVELWIATYAQLSDEARRRLPLKAVYFVTPGE